MHQRATPTTTLAAIHAPEPATSLATIHTATSTPTGTPNSNLEPVTVTFYSGTGLMADGQPAHLGACEALVTQFPFGTRIHLFDPNNLQKAKYACTIEDTGKQICQNDIALALPGQMPEAIQLGTQHLLLQVVGFDQQVAEEAVANHPTSPGCSEGLTP